MCPVGSVTYVGSLTVRLDLNELEVLPFTPLDSEIHDALDRS